MSAAMYARKWHNRKNWMRITEQEAVAILASVGRTLADLDAGQVRTAQMTVRKS